MKFSEYELGGFFDEMIESPGQPRPAAKLLYERIESMPEGLLATRQKAAEQALLDLGITFNFYGATGDRHESIWPFDVLPRIIANAEWEKIEKGLVQRITALNLFLQDIYGPQRIIKDGIIPRSVIDTAEGFYQACVGLTPPGGIWCHITGTDLVRDGEGTMRVLEDNLRCASGVSYVLANRELLMRTFPQVFSACHVRPVSDYPARLLAMQREVAPPGVQDPNLVILTPGVHNSAYFEHSYLARQTGAQLVEGRDMVVSDGYLCVKTTSGLQRVDVVYRRINDDYLDPLVFRPESCLGVPGMMDVYKRGRVTIVNAPGTGVADDKVVYAYTPRMIRYYLDQEPLLPIVDTYLCWEPDSMKYVLENLDKLVVKAANEAGGYGMLIGPHSTKDQQDDFARRIRSAPRNYIAQPTLALSRAPVIVDDHFEGRHVDLRPYILYGKGIYVLPGGLTRVALRKGSLVVNSSQGGGSKDTWVVSYGEGM